MDLNKAGAPARAPISTGTQNRANQHPDYTKNLEGIHGAHQVARLIAGEQMAHPEQLPPPWDSIATELLARRNGRSTAEIFEELLLGREDAGALRAAVLRVRLDASPEPEPDPEIASQDAGLDVPLLPAEAHLPDRLLAQAEAAGTWLNDYTRFAAQASPMSPPSFHIALGLCLLSTGVARRVRVRKSVQDIFPNLYTLLVANSTLYAKSSSLDIARRVLAAAGLDYLMLPVGSTPQSLIGELTHRTPDTFNSWETEEQADWQRGRPFAAQRVWVMDEAGALLDAFEQKYQAGLLNQVLTLYDCPDRFTAASTIARGRQTIRHAYLTICGPTTPAAMRSHLRNVTHWGNGLYARFAFVTPDTPPRREFFPPALTVPAGLGQALSNLALELLPRPRELPTGEIQPPSILDARLLPAVHRHWEAYYNSLWDLINSGRVPERFHPNYGRLHIMAIKVATLLATVDWAAAASDSEPVITPAHWAKAQQITESWRVSLHRMVSAADRLCDEENPEQKVLARLHSAPDGLTSRELANYLNMTRPERRTLLDRILERMAQDGLIHLQERKRARGPVTKAWMRIEGAV